MDLPIRPRQPEDGWIENTGTLPVPFATRVDVIMDGDFELPFMNTPAGYWEWGKGFRNCVITHWRLHDPAVNPSL